MNTRMLSRLSISLSAACLCGAASAQVQWQRLAPAASPGTRAQHGFVSTAPGKPAILFGGEVIRNSYANDTWAWDGQTWTQLSPATSPSPRSGFAMAYDPLRDRIVLFSGWNGGQYLADTWEFDGQTWQQMSPAVQPPPRDWSAMAYDFSSASVILFGGHDWVRTTGGLGDWGDTWAWDGTSWTQLSPANSPSPRWGHGMVFDKNRGQVLLYGGTGGQSETWTWTGSDWQQVVTATAPPLRWRPIIAFDDLRMRTVMYGGVDAGQIRADYWELDANDWVQRTPGGTGPVVTHGAAIWDATLQEIVNQGGALIPDRSSTSDKTDAYGATHKAASQPFGAGCRGTAGTPMLACDQLAWIGDRYELRLAIAPPNAPVTFTIGFSKSRTQSGVPLPLALGIIGMTGCTLYVDPLALGPVNAGPTGVAVFSLPVPPNPVLLGRPLFGQALSVDPGANPLGLTLSNACEHTLGGR